MSPASTLSGAAVSGILPSSGRGGLAGRQLRSKEPSPLLVDTFPLPSSANGGSCRGIPVEMSLQVCAARGQQLTAVGGGDSAPSGRAQQPRWLPRCRLPGSQRSLRCPPSPRRHPGNAGAGPLRAGRPRGNLTTEAAAESPQQLVRTPSQGLALLSASGREIGQIFSKRTRATPRTFPINCFWGFSTTWKSDPFRVVLRVCAYS